MTERGHIAGIDGLRALAVASVLAMHWLPTAYLLDVPTGRYGVRLFFVISGFLITGILLGLRDQPLGRAVKTFYARRFLRIFPVYYAVLAVALVLGLSLVRDALPWHALYASNFYFAHLDRWTGYTDHLWTLAVEEQFYLVWPWIVLLTPRKWLLPAILATISLGPLSRLGLQLSGASDIATGVLPTSCLDTLGAGALLAYARWTKLDLSPWRLPAAVLGVAGIAFALALRSHPSAHALMATLHDLACAALFAAVVSWVAEGRGRWLKFGPLAYVGTISYGVYLFHLFVSAVPVPGPWWVQRIAWAAGTLGVASVSWFLFERPINGLKRLFPYQSPEGAKIVSVSTAAQGIVAR